MLLLVLRADVGVYGAQSAQTLLAGDRRMNGDIFNFHFGKRLQVIAFRYANQAARQPAWMDVTDK